jgi:hypothetical protein
MRERQSTYEFIKEAFILEFQLTDHARYEDDRYPMSPYEKFRYVVSTLLSRRNLQELIHVYNSYRYGADLLDSVFPLKDNPDEFHSRNDIIMLDEHPVQALGWKEYDEIITKGMQLGLERAYIMIGFDAQAEKRGIDLEWSFQQFIPGSDMLE